MRDANSKIRAAWSLFQPPLDDNELALARAKAAHRHALEIKAKASLPEILKQYRWDVDEILCDEISSQYAFELQTSVFIKHLFPAYAVLWIGNPEDSGSPKHRNNFRTRSAWEVNGACGGRYTCASTFKFGTYSRANTNIDITPYLIVEGDKILGEVKTDADKLANKNACGAIFKWLRASVGLELRAVVDAGNKSLHGWFNMPSPTILEELKIVLPAMGCDRAMFKPTQPARIPGVLRDNGNEQKLLWIA